MHVKRYAAAVVVVSAAVPAGLLAVGAGSSIARESGARAVAAKAPTVALRNTKLGQILVVGCNCSCSSRRGEQRPRALPLLPRREEQEQLHGPVRHHLAAPTHDRQAERRQRRVALEARGDHERPQSSGDLRRASAVHVPERHRGRSDLGRARRGLLRRLRFGERDQVTPIAAPVPARARRGPRARRDTGHRGRRGGRRRAVRDRGPTRSPAATRRPWRRGRRRGGGPR
jgi:hypothetical protein